MLRPLKLSSVEEIRWGLDVDVDVELTKGSAKLCKSYRLSVKMNDVMCGDE